MTGQLAQALAGLPKAVLEVIMGSDPEVMRQALAAIDRKYGGPVQLARSRFGLTDVSVARLRDLYLI
jgi:protein-tyrosine phosphatase